MLAELLGRIDRSEAMARVGTSGGVLAELVADVHGVVPGVVPAPPLGAQESRLRLYESLSRFLLGLERPVVLLLDDLHWADRGSLELLEYVGRSLPASSVLVVGAYRPHEVDHAHPLER